ncbi:TMF family protein [Flavobacterium branchiicola]|nr:TMF family protein [Flavobacterium branchiicola]
MFAVFFMLVGFSGHTQTLSPTSNIRSSGSADSFKGGYTFSYASAGTPWNGALISFGGFDNRYDCQISADYGVNGGNRISFRTKNGDENNGVGVWNSWNELATRGENNFIGNQIINGNVGIGTSNPNSRLTIRSGTTGVSIHPGIAPYYGTLAFNRESFTGEIFDPNGQAFQINNGGLDKHLHIQVYNGNGSQVTNDAFVINGINGNVGIGTAKIDSKLTVAGNIAAQEVKVTVNAGADFVFEDNYTLPSLESVAKFLKENKHLPEIASAEKMKEDGINLSEMNIKLLQKIEELTLYLIDQGKKTEELKKNIANQNQRLEKLEK